MANIFDALYNLEESAVKLITSNEETLRAFFEAQRKAQCQLAASGVAFFYTLWSAYTAATEEPAVETKAIATRSSRVIEAFNRVSNAVPAKYRLAGSVVFAASCAYNGYGRLNNKWKCDTKVKSQQASKCLPKGRPEGLSHTDYCVPNKSIVLS